MRKAILRSPSTTDTSADTVQSCTDTLHYKHVAPTPCTVLLFAYCIVCIPASFLFKLRNTNECSTLDILVPLYYSHICMLTSHLDYVFVDIHQDYL